MMLLLALAIVMYNNTANQHIHIFTNGKYIVHAHPFSKAQDSNPQKKHTHTANELFYFSTINNLLSLIIIAWFIYLILQFAIPRLYNYFKVKPYFTVHPLFYQLRAPPVM